MSWAMRRRLAILGTLGAVVVALIATVTTATLYKAPSCVDGKQNQDETGIDCGGSCAYLCTADELAPTVLFTKAIHNGAGRIDVIAEVENKNATAAATNVPYQITLYGAGQTLIQTVSGVLDLPPGARMPVFVPGVASGRQSVVNAFLEIGPVAPRWFALPRDPRILPVVTRIQQSGTTAMPRIDAVLHNPSATALSNVRAIVLVRNGQGDVIATSATIVQAVPAQGEASALFTWDAPFLDTPASIEVLPVIPLVSR